VARLETIRLRLLRRGCLAVLRAARSAGGSGWTAARAAFSFLAPDSDGLALGEVAEAMRYLEGKGYAETRLSRESKFEQGEIQARILPKGIDLLEESIPADPGVEDNRV